MRFDRMDEYPEALRRPGELLPWESGYQPVITVPFPNLRCFGEPLTTLTSFQLLSVRKECERRNGASDYFAPLMEKIDEILVERGGE